MIVQILQILNEKFREYVNSHFRYGKFKDSQYHEEPTLSNVFFYAMTLYIGLFILFKISQFFIPGFKLVFELIDYVIDFIGYNFFYFTFYVPLLSIYSIFFMCYYTIKTYFILLVLFIIKQLLFFLSVVVPVLIGVAYFTLAERKIMGAMQRRLGPNVVGFWGVFQPLADGLKLVVKQTIVPNKSQRVLFLFAPVYTFALALTAWSVIPFSDYQVIANIELGVIFLLTVSTLSVYGLIIAGWSSNSKYAFLGSLRSAAQMISYDVSMGLILLTLLLCTNSCNLMMVVNTQQFMWFVIPFWPLFFMFFVSSLAETNRAPFDLTEAEAELVAGYNVEYSAVGFALFFLAEYSNMLLMSTYISVLFFGGWLAPFPFNLLESIELDWLSLPLLCYANVAKAFWLGTKVLFIAFLFIWVRASLPRYRYDQLMFLGWKVFLPISLGFFLFFSVFLFI